MASNDIVIQQGSTYLQSYTLYTTSGVPRDLTGCTIASELRHNFLDTTASASFTSSLGSPLSSGSFTLGLSYTHSAGIPASTYYYDVELTSGSVRERLVSGSAVVTPEVTKS